MKMLFDISSVIWTCLSVGKDVDGMEVEHNGKQVYINTAAYGYENAVNLMVKALNEWKLTPKDMILVPEGRDSKKRRCMIEPTYKAGRGTRPPEAYLEFNTLKEKLVQTFRDLGAISVTQNFVEGDDVIGYLVKHMEEDCIVVSNDNDLIVLNGINEYGSKCFVRINGEVAVNKYGDFDFKLVTLYKATVGDTSDGIKGCPGFGPAAFLNINARYEDDGCFELMQLIATGKRDAVAQFAVDNECKFLTKIVDNWDSVVRSYRLALLHPEWVNTVKIQLEWAPGMVKSECSDERLRQWRGQGRLVDSANYAQAFNFIKSKLAESPFFSIDFETTTPDESDDWLEQRGKGKVDVIGSTIVSCGITFGKNCQYGFYLTVNHADSNNCTLKQLQEMLALIPQDKFIIAHNAAGFELPVAYNCFGKLQKDNGWRGFIPNMVDTRIAASFWDENQPSHGLKQLTKLLLDYEQATYEQTTSKSAPVGVLTGGVVTKVWDVEGVTQETRQYKMHQITAAETVAYGLDDVYTAAGLWNFFSLFMKLDHTYEAFIKLEQKPMYLSALAYTQGLQLDMERLKKLESEDKILAEKCWYNIESFLQEKGWEGTTCPVFEDLTPANIKQAVSIVTGQEMTTMVRTPSKLAVMIDQLEHESASSLAAFVADGRTDLVNQIVARNFTGKVEFNVGSPKQISKLLYEVIKMPVRLRNKATDSMREKGIREGNPRTDDGAIDMAIKFGDVTGEEAAILKALLEMKSCNTRNGLYWDAYPKNIHWRTGRMHPEIRQSSTNTRRWTGAQPNLQQMEGDPNGVRSTIVAGNGNVFVSLDESSQEVRQMADYSMDENLLSCYIGDFLRDTHSIVGSRIAGISYEDFIAMRKSPDEAIAKAANDIRQKAKITLFASLYGAAAAKIGEGLGISEQEAQGYLDAIFKEFPKVKNWKEESENMAETLGYVTIAGGTKRHLAKLINSDDKWEASKALRQAGNARIQGAGANQLKQVMTDIWDSRLLDDYDYRWAYPVHDETCHIVGVKDAVSVIEILHGFMCKQFLEVVPSESSIGVGRNYGQLKELGVSFIAEDIKSSVHNLSI